MQKMAAQGRLQTQHFPGVHIGRLASLQEAAMMVCKIRSRFFLLEVRHSILLQLY